MSDLIQRADTTLRSICPMLEAGRLEAEVGDGYFSINAADPKNDPEAENVVQNLIELTQLGMIKATDTDDGFTLRVSA